jgi:uncharacterized protein YjbJ (UPF0337 family)
MLIHLRHSNQGVIMLNQDQFKGKWTEIKGGVRNLWGKITDDDLEKTEGNIQSVAGIVQEKYGETKEDIKKKLDQLMDSFDNETDKSLKLNDGISSFEREPVDQTTFSLSDKDEGDDEYEGEEIFDDGEKEDPTYEPRSPGSKGEDRIARH